MKNRKEYNDRWNAKLVNPGFTLPEYEKSRVEVEPRFSDPIIAPLVDYYAKYKKSQK